MSMSSSGAAEIGSVYWALDGGIHHASCGQRMVLRERRPAELVFACVACSQEVAVPVTVLSHIPVAT
jgi:hypothetical protein